MPIPFYIGNSAHNSIGAFYLASHSSPAEVVALNYYSVKNIATELSSRFGFVPEEVELALAEGMPDIFEFSLAAHPAYTPGIVYEIKPRGTEQLAVMKAEAYSTALMAASIPTAPGPIGMVGTSGCVPAPNGWFVFDVVSPGAIIYWYVRAPLVEIRARDKDKGREDTTEYRFQEALISAGANVRVIIAEALLIEALLAAAWILAL
jgi:hypothetical protein